MALSDKGALLEGLSSNFFVVSKGKVFTADEGVLSGSIRELVLEACNELKVAVVKTVRFWLATEVFKEEKRW